MSLKRRHPSTATSIPNSADQKGSATATRWNRYIGMVVVLLMCFITPSTAVCADVADKQSKHWLHAVVAADHPEASKAGLEMLQQGGNVVDAAVATSFALSVVRPASCGIGGGGFMVIWDADTQQSVALDYRERAPAAASRDMFAEPSDAPEPASVRGGKAVAVPGNVAGLCYAAKHYGSLPLSTLLKPAIRLALNGWKADQHDVEVIELTRSRFEKYKYDDRFAPLKKYYLKPVQPGDHIEGSPIWKVLYRISRNGPDAFYKGEIGRAIVDTVREAGGDMTLDDLAAAGPVVRKPLEASFHGHQILTMPPASSGGIALIQTLQSVEAWEQQHNRRLFDLGHNSTDYVHVVVEAMKHAFADRAEFLGDADFASVPIEKLTSTDYARQIASRIQLDETLQPESYGRFFNNDDAGTSHFSVIDTKGNAVACTETINLTFGSFVTVPEFGIILNNQMDDFAARPGEPNAFGLLQSEANAVEPGKKPLSSMTPTVVVEDGKATFASGASGGPKIITATIQVTLNHLIFNLSPQQAVAAPRFHHQWFPNELHLEPLLFESLAKNLRQKSHKVARRSALAANQSASRSEQGVRGGSDPRKHGQPAGY
ncbi:MAG: gamma-glutamyltransferase [Fuerstiella sp.]